MNILSINNLSVEYYRHEAVIHALRGFTLSLSAGETLALVGESGCGKSTVAAAAMGLIFPHEGRITEGEIIFDGKEVRHYTPQQWRMIRGKDIAIVFQDPFSSLNPVISVGEQLREAIDAHHPELPASRQKALALEALEEVRLNPAERIYSAFPHQLSGGQRQRAVIAMAIANRPKLLIADEPTTALDVTIQKEILDLLDALKKELSLTILLITHNLPIAKQRSGRIAVMKEGTIVEEAATEEIFLRPRHEYTKTLIASVPRMLNT
ncbi:MAG: hypothetical protein A2314_05790 [Elusimicrobia bacterium RIFOXYB2_FULL_50_12]|nr:MAG: hypothetical protein A2314_05790 [Elusimicrobia bacterium RIFOXYB2_FULL_50_12]